MPELTINQNQLRIYSFLFLITNDDANMSLLQKINLAIGQELFFV
jgi:hypothetical protein